MLTLALHIKACSDSDFLAEKQKNYSYAFHKIYSNFEKNNDKKFCIYIQKNFKLKDIEFRSLQSDVANKIEQTKTNKANQEQRIVRLLADIKTLEKKKKSNKNTRKIFKLNKKIQYLKDSLKRKITFGGKKTLRELTKLYNAKETKVKIQQQTSLWHKNRILHFYILGEANQNGNRFFNFDFEGKTITYKPQKGKKVELKYSCQKNYQKQLLKLQSLIHTKVISVTLAVSQKQVCISFDDEILSGYYVDTQQRRKEVCEVKKMDFSDEEKTELIKKIYQKYNDKLIAKKLEGKIADRYIAIDPNPDYIGYCIADKGTDSIKKIIAKGVFDLRKLNQKLNLSSDNLLVEKQNNKRVNELQNTLKKLFEIAIHYKVSHFVWEDSEGLGKNEKFDNKESNRKVKNIWCRELVKRQVTKRCIMFGIELIPIHPAFTSFIGNLEYDYFDATNAAIEICRRGMFKYNKGLFYPQVTGTISDTMSRLFESQQIQLKSRDAQIFKDCKKWEVLYKIASNSALRWRWGWDKVERPFSTFSMSSDKSNVSIIKFFNCA